MGTLPCDTRVEHLVMKSIESYLTSVRHLPVFITENMRVIYVGGKGFFFLFFFPNLPLATPIAPNPYEEFPARAEHMWTCLTQLTSGIDLCKVFFHEWWYFNDNQDLYCKWSTVNGALSSIPYIIYSSVLCWSKYAQLTIILHRNASIWAAFNEK